MAHKVKITRLPNNITGKKTGDQHNYELYRSDYIHEKYDNKSKSSKKTIDESDFKGEPSAIEAEKGEVIQLNSTGRSLLDSGLPTRDSLFKVGGKPHSKGGTNLPDKINGDTSGYFVYSKTPSMKFRDPELLESFGVSKPTSPADLAKKFGGNINDYIANVRKANENNDRISRDTNEANIANSLIKLGQIAFQQENLKGFPDGIPDVAIPYLQQIMPQQINTGEGEQQVAKYGGIIKAQPGLNWKPSPYWRKSNTLLGRTSPTGQNTTFSGPENYFQSWEKVIPGITKKSITDAQGLIYDYMLATDPDSIRNMWRAYGLTQLGKGYPDLLSMTSNGKFDVTKRFTHDELKNLKKAYTDGFVGARTLFPNPILSDINFNPDTTQLFSNPFSSSYNNVVKTTDNDNTKPGNNTYSNSSIPITPLEQDKMRLLGALSEPIETQYPTLRTINPIIPDPVLMSPDALVQNTRGVSGELSRSIVNSNDPATRAAALSAQGNILQNLNNIFGQNESANTQIKSNYEANKAAILNQAAVNNLNLLDNYTKGVDATESSFAKAKGLKRADVLNQYDNMQRNAMKMALLRVSNPNYRFNNDLSQVSFVPNAPDTTFNSGIGSTPSLDTELKTLIESGIQTKDAIEWLRFKYGKQPT